jgi:hypothetical protein
MRSCVRKTSELASDPKASDDVRDYCLSSLSYLEHLEEYCTDMMSYHAQKANRMLYHGSEVKVGEALMAAKDHVIKKELKKQRPPVPVFRV